MNSQQTAKYLFDEAILSQLTDDLDEANSLFEQALQLGGLTAHEELCCYHFIGLNLLEMGNLSEGVEHLEKIIVVDPNLKFLSNDMRDLGISELFLKLNASYQLISRKIKDTVDLESAINFLQEKVSLLGRSAAPSILVELGCYYGLSNNHEKANELFEMAIQAPTYGSEFQQEALKSAKDYLE